MAGLPWIQVHSDLLAHPKTIRLGIKLSDERAWSYVVRLWLWAAQHAPGGLVEGPDSEAILATAAGWTREPETMVRALLECRFLDQTPEGYAIHNWDVRAGAHIEKRETERARVRKWREQNANRTRTERVPNADVLGKREKEKEKETKPPRSARVGVGHPAFEAINHWAVVVWPRLSDAACPDVTAPQSQSLSVLSQKHGSAAICAAMDAAASDEFWGPKLDLDGFIAKHARWLGRKNPRAGTGDLGADYRRKWWHELTPAEVEQFNRERCAIDPDLDGVPLDAEGIHRPAEVAALIERWRTRDGQRRVQAAAG